ncbi:MAG: hypothetical protein ABL883_07550 [Terricaulis sp.]
MKWIDHPNYFGPCRRRDWLPVRLIERRADDFSGPPPPLSTAMRQLRQYLLDAHGERLSIFITRVESTALLARMNHELEVSAVLLRLAAVASVGETRDVRPDLIDLLNRAHRALLADDPNPLAPAYENR